MGLGMKRTLAIAFALLLCFAMTGCASAPAKTDAGSGGAQTGAGSGGAQTGTMGGAATTGSAGSKGIAILPASGTPAAAGSEQESALAVAAAALSKLRRDRLGETVFGQTSETFATVNVMRLKGSWYITYSRTLVNGKPGAVYAATFVVDPKTKTIVSWNEKP